jgi:hypothetical protein
LENESEINYPYNKMQLVGGTVHLAGDQRRVDRMNPKPGAVKTANESSFGDVHRWKIDTPGILYSSHETVLPFVKINGIKLETRYVYDATIFNDRVTTHIELNMDSAIGKALPTGNVRIYRKAEDGLLFVGEDGIDNTPVGSPLDLIVGQAFDLTAERVRDLEEPTPDGGTKQKFKVKLGNSGAENIEVEVLERLFGSWSIASATVNGIEVKHSRVDARTAKFEVPVPGGETSTLEYEIIYKR